MRSKYPHLMLTGAAALFAAGCQDLPNPVTPDLDSAQLTHIPGSSGDSKIAFASKRDGNWEIYVMDADGSNQTRLTDDAKSDFPGSWSPDGSQIVFDSNRSNDYEIYVMDADGSNVTQLTSSPGYDRSPHWSPTGDKIAFVSQRDRVAGAVQIYVMDSDGSNATRVSGKEAFVEYNFPRWSPNGSRIVFDRGRGAGREIWTMDPDGSNQAQLTSNGATDIVGDWSPDALTLAFTSARNGSDQIHMMNSNGSGAVRLTGLGLNRHPSHAPDGHSITFVSTRDGNEEIYAMAVDGSGQVNLTQDGSQNIIPIWSPALVAPNSPPSADAGPAATYECVLGGASVTLDGSGSSDPNGDALTYTWSLPGGGTATGVNPAVDLPIGVHTITLTVDDGNGETDSDAVVITVEDTMAPTLTFSLDMTEIWPPNHKMVTVATGISASDACDASPALSIVVESDEPVNGTGDGDTSPDWIVLDNDDGTFDVQVRAERSGNGDGRTYTITVTATDASGNEVEAVGDVVVRHDKGKGKGRGR